MTIRINSRFFFHTIDRATLRSDAFIYFRFSMCGVFSFPGCLHSFCFWHNGHLINQFQIRQLGLLFHRINVVNLLLFAFFSTLLLVYSYLLSVCFFPLASIKSSLMLRRDIFFIVGFGVPQKPAGEIDGLWESNFSSFTTGIRRCVVCVCVCVGVSLRCAVWHGSSSTHIKMGGLTFGCRTRYTQFVCWFLWTAIWWCVVCTLHDDQQALCIRGRR